MKVADANVLVYLVVNSDRTAWARKLFEADSEWYAPTLWRYEVMNVLCTLARRKMLDDAQALEAWNLAERLMQGREIDPSPAAALQLALAHGISGYDAQYVALAREMKCRLLTGDGGIRKAFPEVVGEVG